MSPIDLLWGLLGVCTIELERKVQGPNTAACQPGAFSSAVSLADWLPNSFG